MNKLIGNIYFCSVLFAFCWFTFQRLWKIFLFDSTIFDDDTLKQPCQQKNKLRKVLRIEKLRKKNYQIFYHEKIKLNKYEQLKILSKLNL